MILFLDTSTGNCRIWLGENSFKKELNRNMARDILKFLEDSLENIGKDYKDLEGIGFFAGPGSFTGLRIGASVANTLADGLNIPIVAIKKEDANSEFGMTVNGMSGGVVLRACGNSIEWVGIAMRANDDLIRFIPYYLVAKSIGKNILDREINVN